MAQSAENVLKDLQKNKYAPVYFLQGEEAYYIDLISDYIEKNALAESERSFNQMVIYGKEAEMSAVITNARRFPMMAERQVVLVKEAQELSDLSKEEGLKLLETYLKNPLPSTILVFCHKYKSFDGRKAIGKLIDKHAVLVTTKKLYDNQVPDWVAKYIKGKGFTINAKATQMLADFIGNNLSRMANEIDKMLINFQEKGQIDENIIQKFIGISKEYNVFELQKALTVRDIYKANQIVNYFEANPKNNPIIPAIALLYTFYSKLLLFHHAKDRSDKQLASVLQVSPYFVRDYIAAARNYGLEKVINNIHYLKEADLQSKGVDSGGMTEGQILKTLIFKLMH